MTVSNLSLKAALIEMYSHTGEAEARRAGMDWAIHKWEGDTLEAVAGLRVALTIGDAVADDWEVSGG